MSAKLHPSDKAFEELTKHLDELINSADPIKAGITEAIQSATAILAQRSADYDGAFIDDYMPFGMVSYIQMVHLKTMRLVSICRNQQGGIEELSRYRDSLIDLLNYTLFAIAYLNLEESKSNDL